MHQEIGLGQVRQIISQEYILLKIEIFWGTYYHFLHVLFKPLSVWRKNGYLPRKTMTEIGCGYASMSNQPQYA